MPLYPTPTGVRMAWDRDGSVGLAINGSTVNTTFSAAQRQALNDEIDPGSAFSISNSGASNYCCIIFPELRTITHFFIAFNRNSGSQTKTFQYSLNTTNGVDGTWTSLNSGIAETPTTKPGFRTVTALTGQPIASVKGVRILCPTSGAGSDQWFAFHMYGTKTSTSDRLELWHPTIDASLAGYPSFFDWTDQPQSSSAVKSFRLKNLSGTLTASTITVSADELDGQSPTLASQTTFRYNGGSYSATASLASLAPSTISLVFDMQLTLSASAVLGLTTQRLIASATTWS